LLRVHQPKLDSIALEPRSRVLELLDHLRIAASSASLSHRS